MHCGRTEKLFRLMPAGLLTEFKIFDVIDRYNTCGFVAFLLHLAQKRMPPPSRQLGCDPMFACARTIPRRLLMGINVRE